MKISQTMKFTGIVSIVLALLLTVGNVFSQSPVGNGLPSSSEIAESATPISEEAHGSDQIEERGNTEYILAQPPSTMNYQGYLTDSSGSPLNGSYDMVFQLHDDVMAGSIEWGPETHDDVLVKQGIFQVVLGTTVNLHSSDFDEALFLAVAVNGTNVTPRQPLHAVPYAFGLVPGAEIEGDPAMTNYGLHVDNTGENQSDRGIYASGEQYGIFAEEVGADSDVGIYSPDYIHAKGFRSNEDSYLWVPGTAAMLYPTTGCTLYSQSHGSVRLECSSSGTKYIDLPVTVPGVLFGQSIRVESIQILYDLNNASSYIDNTYLRKLTGAGTSTPLVTSSTNRTSTSPTSYSLDATGEYTLTITSGPLNVRLDIWHDGDLSHDVNIGGVRVRLRHYDQP